mmetsp:Transcript_69513/g.182194  ORF Transcript_69513/g.182194 Transcript_69513/m.182194 type:complete len:241 (+) Transcript_69513:719-1441(+)
MEGSTLVLLEPVPETVVSSGTAGHSSGRRHLAANTEKAGFVSGIALGCTCMMFRSTGRMPGAVTWAWRTVACAKVQPGMTLPLSEIGVSSRSRSSPGPWCISSSAIVRSLRRATRRCIYSQACTGALRVTEACRLPMTPWTIFFRQGQRLASLDVVLGSVRVLLIDDVELIRSSFSLPVGICWKRLSCPTGDSSGSSKETFIRRMRRENCRPTYCVLTMERATDPDFRRPPTKPALSGEC